MYFSSGGCPLELAQRPLRVALALHIARRSAPFGVTMAQQWQTYDQRVHHHNGHRRAEVIKPITCISCKSLTICVDASNFNRIVFASAYTATIAYIAIALMMDCNEQLRG